MRWMWAAERRANSNELWREILRLAFENPKLSDPTIGLAKFDYVAKTIDGNPEQFRKYEMFVDRVLNASEGYMDQYTAKFHAFVDEALREYA